MKEFKLLQKVKDTAGKNEKLRLLKEGETENLKRILFYTYNSFLTYRIKQIVMPEEFNRVQPDITDELCILLDKLAKHETGTIAAQNMIKNLLSKCTKENAEWVCRVIDRHLDVGVDAKGINKVFPKLIPVFDVMLAHPITEFWDDIKYPIMIDAKKDGLFNAIIYDGEKVQFFSRDGNEFPNLQAFSEQIIRLSAGQPRVFIGEFDTVKLYDGCKSAVKAHKAGKNWKFQQSISMAKTSDVSPAVIKEHQKLVLWDVIDYEYFTTQGTSGVKEKQKDRRMNLFALFSRSDSEFKNLECLPCYYANNKLEVIVYRDKFISEDDEGCMGKDPEGYYEFKRSKNVLKCKQFFTADLRIVGAIEGEGKYKGTLGALLMEGNEISTKVGSGFSDDERDELWYAFKTGRLTGQIGEVLYQEITADNSLRFPSWLRLRPDKAEVSFY